MTPHGWHSVTTRLVVDDPAALVVFLQRAFEAVGEFEDARPSVVRVGDSPVMVSRTGPRARTSAFLYVYVDDADVAYARALEAGGTSVEEPCDRPYGDRRAMITDPFGNDWQIATYRPEDS